MSRASRPRTRPRGATGGRIGLLVLVCALAGGCGKKGAPLAPIVHVPRPVTELTVRQAGADVYVTFTVPSQNVDGSTPADVRRIDLFAVTADAAPPRERFLRLATRLAIVRVAPAMPDGVRPPPSGSLTAVAEPTVAPGATVVVRETLTGDQRKPVALPATSAPAASPPAASSPPAARAPATQSSPSSAPNASASPSSSAPAAVPAGPQRFYMALAFSDRERSSAPGTVASLPIALPPDPPAGVAAAYSATAVTVSWRASAAGAAYYVYRTEGPPAGAGAERARVAVGEPAPVPLQPTPLSTTGFSDEVQFDVQRCYRVSAVVSAGGASMESAPSPPACVTPVDTFPPMAPTELTAVAREDGAIELRWMPNTERDLGGYLILRGTAGDDTLREIAQAPLAQARYIDRDVRPGVEYVYAVVAIDSHMPPNRSDPSARDTATAR